jgi:hypothetical protein
MTMHASYSALRERWRAGERERGLALHLMFFAWMHWAEPPHLTGLTDDSSQARTLWLDVFSSFGGEDSSDVEFLYVTALMAELFPYMLGDESEWIARAERLWMRARSLQPNGMAAADFDERGEYGRYFAHQAPNFAARKGKR